MPDETRQQQRQWRRRINCERLMDARNWSSEKGNPFLLLQSKFGDRSGRNLVDGSSTMPPALGSVVRRGRKSNCQRLDVAWEGSLEEENPFLLRQPNWIGLRRYGGCQRCPVSCAPAGRDSRVSALCIPN